MKVLFAAQVARLDGGATQSLVALVSALAADDRFEPVVTVPRPGALSEALDARSIPWRVVRTPPWVAYTDPERSLSTARRATIRARRLADVARGIPAWVALLRRERPAVVVTTTAGIPTPAVACLLSRTPHVWWLHELMSPRFGSWFVLGDAFSQRAIGLLSRRVLTVSHTVEAHYSRRIAARKLRAVYLGIVTPPTPDSAVAPGALRVVSLGRLTSAKGSATAVRALAAVNDERARVTLRLVGPVTPEYRRVLEHLADDLGVRDRLELVDFTTDPHAQIEWGNVLLTCAVDEAFGRSTAEALKSGRPVIGVRSGGTEELVDDGVDGILFEPGDVAAAARAMEALAVDPARLAAMGRAARARNHSRFEVADEVAGVAAVLAEATPGATR